jgi:hypothetical protein
MRRRRFYGLGDRPTRAAAAGGRPLPRAYPSGQAHDKLIEIALARLRHRHVTVPVA